MAFGPGPDLPTHAELEEFRRKLREYDDKSEAERELDRMTERYEAWRAKEAKKLDIVLEDERHEIALQQDRLSERERKQIRIEQKFDEETRIREAELQAREAKIIPTEKLLAAQADLDRDRAELAEESWLEAEEHRRRQAAFDAATRRVLKDLKSVEEILVSFRSESSLLGWVRRSSAETIAAQALARLQHARNELEQAAANPPQ